MGKNLGKISEVDQNLEGGNGWKWCASPTVGVFVVFQGSAGSLETYPLVVEHCHLVNICWFWSPVSWACSCVGSCWVISPTVILDGFCRGLLWNGIVVAHSLFRMRSPKHTLGMAQNYVPQKLGDWKIRLKTSKILCPPISERAGLPPSSLYAPWMSNSGLEKIAESHAGG